MFLQLHVWAFMLLQEAPVNFDVRGMWDNMGWAAKTRRHPAVLHVGMVDRCYDRSRHRV